MQRAVLRAEIHRAMVTGADLDSVREEVSIS
jgi:aspartate 1-decarboxylase